MSTERCGGSLNRIALVVAGAECVFDDLNAALALFTPDRVYAVNDIGAHLETLHAWCTLHPEFMDKWEADRRRRGLPDGYEIVAPLENMGEHNNKGNVTRRVSYRWDETTTSSASSGMFAVKVALHDGYDRVLLVGLPLDTSNHFARGRPWLERASFIRGFENATPHLLGRVKSMSGHTRRVLGAPCAEWLAGSGDPTGAMGEMPALQAMGEMPKGN